MRSHTFILCLLLMSQLVLGAYSAGENIDMLGYNITNSGASSELATRTYVSNSISWINTSGNATKVNGNVGIGTTGPTEKLTVVGNTLINTTHTALQEVGTAVDGTESLFLAGAKAIFVQEQFAYVVSSTDDALVIFDVSDKTNPVEVGVLSDESSPQAAGTATTLNEPRGIYVQGNYAYVPSYSDSGISIIDVSNKSDPMEVGTIRDVENSSYRILQPRNVYVQGKYLYVTSWTEDALTIIDVSDPTNPEWQGHIYDVEVGGTGHFLDGAYGIQVRGKYAYVTGYQDSGMDIIDISDPTNPKSIGNISDGGVGGSASEMGGAFGVGLRGNYAIVSAYNDDAISVVNITDPRNPVEVGEADTGDELSFNTNPWGFTVRGDYAFAGGNSVDTLTVIDVRDPTTPVEVAYIRDSEQTDGNATYIDGIKNVFVEGQYAYVVGQSDNGFSIIDLGGLHSHAATIGSVEAGRLTTSHLTVDEELRVLTGVSVGPGGIMAQNSGSFNKGNISIERGKVGIGTSRMQDTLKVHGGYKHEAGNHSLKELAVINDSESGGVATYLDYPIDLIVRGDYAYTVSFFDGAMSIFDISDKSSIREIGSYVSGGDMDSPRSMAMQGNVVYVGTNADNSIVAIDVSDPTDPQKIGLIQDKTQGGTALMLDDVTDIDIQGNYLYAIANLEGGFSIIDISDPRNMNVTAYINDTFYGGTATNLSGARNIQVVGEYAYVTSVTDDALSIFDVSDPYAIEELSVLADDGSLTLQYPSSILVSGSYAYITALTDAGLSIINISDPFNPVEVGALTDSEAGGTARSLDSPLSSYLVGDFLYVATQSDMALTVIDVSDPTNPTEVAFINDSEVGGTAQGLDGAATVWVEGNYAYVTALQDDSLSIFEIGGLDAHAMEAGSVQATTMDVTKDLEVSTINARGGLNSGGTIYSDGDVGTSTGFRGNAFGWASMTADGTQLSGELYFGGGISVPENTHTYKTYWNDSGGHFHIYQDGVYEVISTGLFDCQSNTALTHHIKINGTGVFNSTPYCHSSVDPVTRTLHWVGDISYGSTVRATFESASANVGWDANSTLLVRRIT